MNDEKQPSEYNFDELVDILECCAEYWERLQKQAEATKDDPFMDWCEPRPTREG